MTDDLISRAGLLPCPFCGGEAKLIKGPPGCAFVRCETCKATSDDRLVDRAVAAWNTRALPAAQVQAEPVAADVGPWTGMGGGVAPKADPNCDCICHRQPGVMHIAACCHAPTAPAPDDLDALVERLQKLGRDMDRHAAPDWDEHEDVFAAVNAITALRARPDTAQVKPLVWESLRGKIVCCATSIVGPYEIERDGSWIALWHCGHRISGALADVDAAKAAAQADYEARIRAALVASEPAPASHQPPLPSEDAQGGEV